MLAALIVPDTENRDSVPIKPFSVSVIVLTFNSEKYIGRCLDALAAQVFKDFEILIVDAGSTDATLGLVDSYRKKLNIRVLDAPGTNMGQARNIGIRSAKGKFLCFCDADDYFLPAKIDIQVNFFRKNPEYAACYYDAFHFQSTAPDKIYLARRSAGKSGVLLAEFLRAQTININTLMVRRQPSAADILFPADDAGRYAEDWQYLINLAIAGVEFGFLPGSYSMIECRTDSHTSWKIQHFIKYYALAHLIASKANILDRGISRTEFVRSMFKHRLKFFLSCCVVGQPEYYFLSQGAQSNSSITNACFKLLCIVLFKRKFFRATIKLFWVLKQRVRVVPMAHGSRKNK